MIELLIAVRYVALCVGVADRPGPQARIRSVTTGVRRPAARCSLDGMGNLAAA